MILYFGWFCLFLLSAQLNILIFHFILSSFDWQFVSLRFHPMICFGFSLWNYQNQFKKILFQSSMEIHCFDSYFSYLESSRNLLNPTQKHRQNRLLFSLCRDLTNNKTKLVCKIKLVIYKNVYNKLAQILMNTWISQFR